MANIPGLSSTELLKYFNYYKLNFFQEIWLCSYLIVENCLICLYYKSEKCAPSYFMIACFFVLFFNVLLWLRILKLSKGFFYKQRLLAHVDDNDTNTRIFLKFSVLKNTIISVNGNEKMGWGRREENLANFFLSEKKIFKGCIVNSMSPNSTVLCTFL